MELVVWILGAELTLSILVLSWIATTLGTIRLSQSKIESSVAHIQKEIERVDHVEHTLSVHHDRISKIEYTINKS